jgi:16S rRNA processing protein RimM
VKGELIPYFIESIAIVKGSRAIVAFEDVDTIEQAERLINCAAYLPLAELDPLRMKPGFIFTRSLAIRLLMPKRANWVRFGVCMP